MAESKREKVRQDISALQAEYYQILAEIDEKKVNATYKRPTLLTIKGRPIQLDADKEVDNNKIETDEAESKLDEAEFELLANQEVMTRKQKIKTVLARLGGDPNTSFEQHPDFISAEAQLSLAKMNLGYTEVRAPVGVLSQD